jgi:hypothetical protein
MHLFWSSLVGLAVVAGVTVLAPERAAGDVGPIALLGIVGAMLADALVRTPGDSRLVVIGPALGAVIVLAGHRAVRRRTLRRNGLGRRKPNALNKRHDITMQSGKGDLLASPRERNPPRRFVLKALQIDTQSEMSTAPIIDATWRGGH